MTALLTLLLAVAGFNGPQIVAEPSTLVFENMVPGVTRSETVTLRNVGDIDAELTAVVAAEGELVDRASGLTITAHACSQRWRGDTCPAGARRLLLGEVSTGAKAMVTDFRLDAGEDTHIKVDVALGRDVGKEASGLRASLSMTWIGVTHPEASQLEPPADPAPARPADSPGPGGEDGEGGRRQVTPRGAADDSGGGGGGSQDAPVRDGARGEEPPRGGSGDSKGHHSTTRPDGPRASEPGESQETTRPDRPREGWGRGGEHDGPDAPAGAPVGAEPIRADGDGPPWALVAAALAAFLVAGLASWWWLLPWWRRRRDDDRESGGEGSRGPYAWDGSESPTGNQ